MCKCVCVCQGKRVISRRGGTCQEQLLEKTPFSFPFILSSFSVWHSPYNYSLLFILKTTNKLSELPTVFFPQVFFVVVVAVVKASNHPKFVLNQTISPFPHSKDPKGCRLNRILCCVSPKNTTPIGKLENNR